MSPEAKTSSEGAPAPPPPPPGAPAAPAKDEAPVAAAPTAAPAKAKTPAKSQQIIFTGDLKMMADEDALTKTIDRIIDLADNVGGHVQSRKDNDVQIKVPSPSFRDTMKAINDLGGVTSQSISAEDVSEEMHDLDVRLTNLRATRTRLQELMNKAGAIPDVLTVEKELERVASEIDKIEGRLQFLKTRTSESTIDVHLTAKPKQVQQVATGTPAPAKPRVLDLPVPWVGNVGIDPLLSLKK